jgi:small conductance mechanosensitive channel
MRGGDTGAARGAVVVTEAARSAGLEAPFVLILELGDFSVTYRVAGFLAERKP